MKKIISIIGAGAMGTALAILFSKCQRGRVKLWDRDPELISQLRSKIPKDIFLFTDLKIALKDANLILLAVPSFAIREVCQKISNLPLPPILMIAKGMEKETSLLPFQIVKEVLGKEDILHLTWSRFADDIYKRTKTAEILASKDKNLLKEFKNFFQTDWLSISTTIDLLGIQLAGALKNVVVIGIGLADEGKLEIKQKLIEESVKEMIELGKVMGAKEETFLGPAGKINLELSANSRSRNYCFGKVIFEKGINGVQKQLKGSTIEGFHTAWAVYQLAKKYGVRLPIVEEVYKVIYENKDPKLIEKEIKKIIKKL